MVDLFTIFGKVVARRALGLAESGRHSQKSRPPQALQTKRVATGVVVQNKPSPTLLWEEYASSFGNSDAKRDFHRRRGHRDGVFSPKFHESIELNLRTAVKARKSRDPPREAYKSHRRRSRAIGCSRLSITPLLLYATAPTVNICVCSTGCNGGGLRRRKGIQLE